MGSIFISYRRSDSADAAGRIYDRLVSSFAEESVFKDVDSIPLGESFPSVIKSQLENAAVVLVLIGRSWLECVDSTGRRRLDDPEDYVRIEIETALRVGVPLIPVIVSSARMPQPSELPASLKPFAEKNGQTVGADPDFHFDMNRLIRRLRQLMQIAPSVTIQTIDRNFLIDTLACAQDWYNEIIETSTKLNTGASAENKNAIEFVYVHTRSFLPRLLSARKILPSFKNTESLVSAIDKFIDLLTFTENDQSSIEQWSRCVPLSSFYRGESPVLAGTSSPRLGEDARHALQRVSDPDTLVTGWDGLGELRRALQRVSDAVTQLLATYGQDSRKA